MPFQILKDISWQSIVSNRRVFYLLSALSVVAVLLTAWQDIGSYLKTGERDRENEVTLRQHFQIAQNQLSNIMGSHLGSLSVLASAISLLERPNEQYDKAKNSPNTHSQYLFLSVLKSNQNIITVRYINELGEVILKIDRHEQTTAQKVENQAPIRKAVLDDIFSLSSGKFHLSEVGLSYENGAIRSPPTPSFFLSVPVFENNNSLPYAALLMEVDARYILDTYKIKAEILGADIHLVDNQGDWIFGKPESDLWGSVYNNKKGLPQENTLFWESVKANDIDQVKKDHGFTLVRVNKRDLIPSDFRSHIDDGILWYVLIKNKPIHAFNDLMIMLPLLVLLIMLLIFGWAWVRSISDKYKAEKELLKSEKLSSLGRLVAGVSHELNTPIGSALTMASTIEDRAKELIIGLKDEKSGRHDIDEFIKDTEFASHSIIKGLMKAADLIGNFKQIAVDQTGEARRSFILDDYVNEMSATFNHLFKHSDITLELDLNAKVELDSFPGALSQVIINLVQNALLHGYADGDHGIIKLTT